MTQVIRATGLVKNYGEVRALDGLDLRPVFREQPDARHESHHNCRHQNPLL
jgi:hypothetical protein